MLDLACHSDEKFVTLRDIAKRQTISLSYLEQLFSKLREAEIVTGVRGPGGGYQLGRDSRQINVAEIILAVDEVVDSTKCGGKTNCQNSQPCLTHQLWAGLSDQIQQYLRAITLQDLLQSQHVRSVAKRQDIGATHRMEIEVKLQARA